MRYSEIQIWGDSIARGVTLDARRGRYALSPQRCCERLKGEGVAVVNRAAMGATVLDGLKRFEDAPEAPGALCVIEFGGNDCDLPWARVADDPNMPITANVPLDSYRQGLRRFIAEAVKRGMKPLLATPPPLDAPRYFRWVTRGLNAANVLRALGDVEHIYRWQERYTIALRAVAAETGCALLDVRDAFLSRKDVRALLSADGIHPSDEGHRLIADTAVDALAQSAARAV